MKKKRCLVLSDEAYEGLRTLAREDGRTLSKELEVICHIITRMKTGGYIMSTGEGSNEA